ncbi:MAG: hypothetical protein ACOX9A_09340 [Anaerolineae bacterium]|jgi:predicted homoserine dehydrogenase-like protein
MIYQHLFSRVSEPDTVRAGLIGAGEFGTPIVTQSRLIPRLDIPVVADLDIEAGRRAFLRGGVPADEIMIADSHSAACRALEAGKRVVLPDGLLMVDLPLHVIATATRSPEAGARYAQAAIEAGKHVVMIDKEADSVVGPILKQMADHRGVVYTTDDGDEPGLLMGLVSWARSLGLEILCGGNLHGAVYDEAAGTVTSRGVTVQIPESERWAMQPIPPGGTLEHAGVRRELFAPFRRDEECGDPMAHMAVSANGTGLLPDCPTGHRPVLRYTELPEVLCPREYGGILETRGAVDIPTVLWRADEPNPGGGVFIIVHNPDEASRDMMIRKGVIASRNEEALLLYRPYHLCGAETAMSILCAGLLRVPTGSGEILPRVDIIATAARDFKAGEILGSRPGTLGWNRDLRASLVPGYALEDSRPLPFFMLEGNRLAVDVPAGTTITQEMVVSPGEMPLWSLRARQDAHFYRTTGGR